MRQLIFRKFSVFVLFCVIVITACVFDKPTEPKPPEIKEYPIYFCNRGGYPDVDKALFRYLPSTQTIDSVMIPYYPFRGISVSADGKLLYLSLDNTVVILDTENFDFVRELPYMTRNRVVVSSDNSMIALVGDTIRILRTSDYEVIYSDIRRSFLGEFSSDNQTFYCSVLDTNGLNSMYKLDLRTNPYTKTIKSFEGKSVGYILPTPDESKIVFYNSLGLYVSAFEVYDVALDSMIFQDILVPGSGTVVLSPDGNKAVYTGPGRTGTDPPVDPFFKVFDLPSNSIERVIDSLELLTEDTTYFARPNYLAITPDNKYLGVLSGVMAKFEILIFEMQTFTMLDRRNYVTNQYDFTPMTVQNRK